MLGLGQSRDNDLREPLLGPQRQQPLPSINRNEESNGLDDSAEMGQRVNYRELRR
jgi:hypothetical protein